MGNLKDKGGDVKDYIKDKGGDFLGNLKDNGGDVKDNIKDNGGDFLGNFKDKINKIEDYLFKETQNTTSTNNTQQPHPQWQEFYKRPTINPNTIDQYTYNGLLPEKPSSNYIPITADFGAFGK